MTERPLISDISELLFALYTSFFLSGLISFASSEKLFEPQTLAFLIYAIYGLGLIFSIRPLLRSYELRRDLVKILLVCLFSTLPVFLNGNGLDSVEKSHLAAMGSIFIFTAVAVIGGIELNGRFAASVIVLTSLFCLVDAIFINGLSNTTGRAAALFVNPNVAGLTLLIGATGAIWAVPSHWRLAFVVLVGGAVFSTLSRSSMLLGALTLISTLPLVKSFPERRHLFGRESVIAAVLMLGAVIAIFSVAYANNLAITVATSDAMKGLRSAKVVWQDSQRDGGDNSLGGSEGGDAKAASVKIERDGAGEPPKVPELIKSVEQENSAAARAILLQRAIGAYRSGPISGRGLAQAFELAPHNSYFFFVVAFGHLGWLIIPGFVVLILRIAGWRRGLPPAVAISGGAFFSHDVFIGLPLVAAISVVLAGLIGSAHDRYELPPTSRWPQVVVTLLLAGGSVIALANVVSTHRPYEVVIDTTAVSHVDGAAYYFTVHLPEPIGLVRVDARGENRKRENVLDEEIVGECSASIEDVIRKGQGRCHCADRALVFSSSDNGSPVEDGRRYVLSVSRSVHPLSIVMVGLVLIWASYWCIIAYRRFFRGYEECAASRDL